MAAAGAGVCSLGLWAVRSGQSSLRAIICMINNLRYAQGHHSLSPDYRWPRKRADDGFSHKLRDCRVKVDSSHRIYSLLKRHTGEGD